MNVGNVLNAGFEVQYLLGNGLVQNVSQTNRHSTSSSGASARATTPSVPQPGIFKSVVSIALIVAANMFAKRTGDDSLF